MAALVVFATGAQSAGARPFTVTEEIELAWFGDPNGGEAKEVQFSPNGRYFAALTERGRLDLNQPEDTLRVYRTSDTLDFLRKSKGSQPPTPYWTFSLSTDKDGPIVSSWRWLENSRGIAFLERGIHGSHRLALAEINTKEIEALTPDGTNVTAYDIRDREHYVYTVSEPALRRRALAEVSSPAIVGTGRSLVDLLLPASEYESSYLSDRGELWAVNGGAPFQVKQQPKGDVVVLFSEGQRNIALSPDGQSLLTVLPVQDVPPDWEELYRPSHIGFYRLRVGKQDLTTFDGSKLIGEYVLVDLRTGAVRRLADGPTGWWLGWDDFGGALPTWSVDGTAVALPSAFVTSDRRAIACVVVTDLHRDRSSSCAVPLVRPGANGIYDRATRYHELLQFENGHSDRLRVDFGTAEDDGHGSTVFRRTAAGTWATVMTVVRRTSLASGDLIVAVNQGLNEPPKLVATDARAKTTAVLWDPNPQLKDIVLREAEVFHWKDESNRDWRGGLYKPVNYQPGRRYPLVVQTHGFGPNEFRPSGLWPTGFAARALAAAGIAVLQSDMCPILGSPEEGPCNVAGLEAAIRALVKEGLVDPERVGMIGFSRSCYHVVDVLIEGSVPIKAVSLTDGVMLGYEQYLSYPRVDDEYDILAGARPFGEGLQQWLKRSPLFNMDKINAAVQVVAEGPVSLMELMWEPYAVMRALNKPVDLIVLNNSEHILTNPSARLASQGGSVDWFRFWLQDYEDPDPTKSKQYQRWRELKTLFAKP